MHGTVPSVLFIKRFIAQTVYTVCTRINYEIVPVTSLNKYWHYATGGTEKYVRKYTYSMVQSPSWEANWFAASQEIPTFHGTRRFITALTSVRHPSLSWASPIQSIYPHPTSWRSVLILSTHPRLGANNNSEKLWTQLNTANSGKLIKAVYASYPLLYLLHGVMVN